MALVAAAVAFAVVGGRSAEARRTKARAGGYWILLESNRDGVARGYSVRPDGSRLTPLLSRGHALDPVAVSRDGGTIAYRDRQFAIYVSRANGTGVRRLVRETGFDAALSDDGRLLAFVTSGTRDTISVVGTDGRGRRRLTPGRRGPLPRLVAGRKGIGLSPRSQRRERRDRRSAAVWEATRARAR